MSRISVVLFNLGGPDSPAAVKPFLKNLFSDPAIIRAPTPVRWLLARLISARRAPVAQAIYAHMGSRSPILPETEAQARALSAQLKAVAAEDDWQVAIAMRYWHPFADAAAREVAGFHPDRVVLLPLYPQYSTTTTASSAKDWARAARAAGIAAPTTLVCCYPQEPGFIESLTAVARDAIARARTAAPAAPLHVLFSAHGLPKRVVAAGDPYQGQVERTVAAVVSELKQDPDLAAARFTTCYQSRVGPLEWIGPATDETIRAAADTGAAIVVVPVAFVSEHSETLVELDIEYRKLAAGAAAYERAPAVGTAAAFIEGLARQATGARAAGAVVSGGETVGNVRTCPAAARCCAGPDVVS